MFLDVKDSICHELGASNPKFNQGEIQVVVSLLEDLLKFGYEPADIGIISPYNAQLSIFARGVSLPARKYVKLDIKDLLIETMDASQAEQRKT